MEGKTHFGVTYYPSEGYQMVLNIKADPEGIAFVRTLQEAFNKDWDFRIRGSLKNRREKEQEVGHTISDQSVPIHLADRWRVYISRKAQAGSYVNNAVQLMSEDLQELAASLAETKEGARQWKNTAGLQREQIIQYRNALQDKENEITDLKEQLLKFRYHGASQADIELCERWKDTNLIKMARSMYQMIPEKLKVLKVFKDGSGLGLKEAKTVCDYLVFK